MNKLIIIGAGKFGREVYAWAKQCSNYGTDWDIKGFLDNRPDILNNYRYDCPILASAENYVPDVNDRFICAIADPIIKKSLCNIMLSRGAIFCNVIHPTVIMGENARIGTGVILSPYVIVSCDAEIENFVSINLHSVVGHDVKIGEFSQINPHVTISGGASIEYGVTIGCNACILPNAVIEKGAVVGAGSVVLRRVPPYQTVFGVPAKKVALPKAPLKTEVI